MENFVPSKSDEVYLVPGTRPVEAATELETELGDALDDVTIVLVNPREAEPGVAENPLTTGDAQPAVADVREVTAVRRTSQGVTTHLFGLPDSAWSPRSVAEAIQEIQAGTAQYFTRAGDRVAFLEIKHARGGGAYLRASADGLPANNLDNLPQA
jgi:hypothetical protein